MDDDANFLKRKLSDLEDDSQYFTLCSNVKVKTAEVKSPVRNRIFEYRISDTWFDVLYDLLRDTDIQLRKNENIQVCVSSKLNGTESFYPDILEQNVLCIGSTKV